MTDPLLSRSLFCLYLFTPAVRDWVKRDVISRQARSVKQFAELWSVNRP